MFLLPFNNSVRLTATKYTNLNNIKEIIKKTATRLQIRFSFYNLTNL